MPLPASMKSWQRKWIRFGLQMRFWLFLVPRASFTRVWWQMHNRSNLVCAVAFQSCNPWQQATCCSTMIRECLWCMAARHMSRGGREGGTKAQTLAQYCNLIAQTEYRSLLYSYINPIPHRLKWLEGQIKLATGCYWYLLVVYSLEDSTYHALSISSRPKPRRAACTLRQHCRFCSLWGWCLQGRSGMLRVGHQVNVWGLKIARLANPKDPKVWSNSGHKRNIIDGVCAHSVCVSFVEFCRVDRYRWSTSQSTPTPVTRLHRGMLIGNSLQTPYGPMINVTVLDWVCLADCLFPIWFMPVPSCSLVNAYLQFSQTLLRRQRARGNWLQLLQLGRPPLLNANLCGEDAMAPSH